MGRSLMKGMNRFRTVLACLAAGVPAAPGMGSSGPGLLLVDDSAKPTATISWPTRDNQTHEFKEEGVTYTCAEQRTVLGDNLELFVAVGGTRLDKQAGHKDGAIIRVGFYKSDNTELLFKGLAEDSVVTVTLTGVKFNQAVLPNEGTVLQHLKYTKADVEACGLGESDMDQYNTESADDTMGGIITEENARLGGLDGSDEDSGHVSVTVEKDGTVSLKAEIPYEMFRHVRDPWLRTTPGSFFEPYHFHIEFEILPEAIAPAAAKTEAEVAPPGSDPPLSRDEGLSYRPEA